MNAAEFGKLTHNQCPACGSRKVLVGEFPKPTNEGDLVDWLTNGDTGISSLTIYHVITGRRVDWTGWPADPSDFGRCYRLLKIMPSWRARLTEVATRYPKTPWTNLIASWDDVQALYEEELPAGTAPKCYALMKELGC